MASDKQKTTITIIVLAIIVVALIFVAYTQYSTLQLVKKNETQLAFMRDTNARYNDLRALEEKVLKDIERLYCAIWVEHNDNGLREFWAGHEGYWNIKPKSEWYGHCMRYNYWSKFKPL